MNNPGNRKIQHAQELDQLRLKLEKVEREYQEMREILSTLAGGVAHSFNNLLMGIQGNVSLLLLDMDTTDRRLNKLLSIENQVKRGMELTARLLSVPGPPSKKIKSTDPKEVIMRWSELLQREKNGGGMDHDTRMSTGRGQKDLEGHLTGRKTILLVDDDEAVLEVEQKMLETLGYHVFSTNRGKEAVKIYKEHKSTIRLIILDLIMPEMSGVETFEQLKKINPVVKVLISSGFSVEDQAAQLLNRGCEGFLQKPFGIEELSRKVREILGKV